jgi:hypothetical protein
MRSLCPGGVNPPRPTNMKDSRKRVFFVFNCCPLPSEGNNLLVNWSGSDFCRNPSTCLSQPFWLRRRQNGDEFARKRTMNHKLSVLGSGRRFLVVPNIGIGWMFYLNLVKFHRSVFVQVKRHLTLLSVYKRIPAQRMAGE